MDTAMNNTKKTSYSGRKVTEFRNYHLPDYFPVLLLTGPHWKISDIPSGRLHFHNCLEVGICHSQSGTLEFYGEYLTFKEGDVTCIPKNIPHTTYSSRGENSTWSYLFFEPKKLFGNWLPGTWENINLEADVSRGYEYILRKSEYTEVYTLVQQIIAEMTEKKPGYQMSTRGLLLSLYIQLYRIQNIEASKGGTAQEDSISNTLVLAPALKYIEENYMESFPMETLANLCHWTPTHFRRVFSQIMGISPLEYVNYVRIAEACNLLGTTEDSVLSISENTGFGSVSSFNRNFQETVKMSPREYRKQIADTVLEFNGWMIPEEK